MNQSVIKTEFIKFNHLDLLLEPNPHILKLVDFMDDTSYYDQSVGELGILTIPLGS